MFRSVKSHFLALFLGTLLAAFSLLTIVRETEPSSGLALSVFYASLFLVFAGGGAFIGLVFRRLFFKGTYLQHLVVSLRQGIFLGGIAMFTFVLLSNRLFSWILFAGVVFVFFIIEFLLS